MLAALWCFLACGPTSIVEVGLIPALLCFAIRAPRHLRVDWRFIHLTAAQLTLLWIAWVACSTQWSANRSLGLDEVMANRFALSLVILWPVLDKRSWLIAGLVCGFLAANLAQAAHAVGSALDLSWLQFPRQVHRNSGWWQPVVGGSMLTAALGLHLPAALTGSLRTRAVGVAGGAVSFVGVLATGSRGAWVASAALVAVAALWALWRARKGAGRRAGGAGAAGSPAGLRPGHLPLVAALLFLIGLGAQQALWPSIRERGARGVDEIRAALHERDYSTDTGARVLMAEVAVRAFLSHPVRGVGAGGFRAWGRAWLIADGRGHSAALLHDHAHNTILHVAATTGLIGAGLLVCLVGVSIRGGLWNPDPDAGPVAGYAAGPAMALVGLVLVSAFDVIPMNAQTSALFWTLVVLCLWGRPREARGPGASVEDPAALAPDVSEQAAGIAR